MVKSAPASFLILTKSEFLCQFFVIAPHDPAMLRHSHQSRKFGGCGQSGYPVPGRFSTRLEQPNTAATTSCAPSAGAEQP
jgi:hypothetical protein